MPSEKQIQAAAKAMETLALERGFVPWDEAASVALTAAEQAEPAPAAEPVACVERGSEQSTPQPESRLREALEGIDSIITNSINENGSDYHRMKIGEEWYDGPVVDALHKILMGLREISRAALAQGQGGSDDTLQTGDGQS